MEVATFRGFVAFREHYLYSCHSHAFYHAVGADHARDHARGVAHPFLSRLAHFVWDLRKLACASALGLDFGATRFLHHPLAEADTHDYAHVAPSSFDGSNAFPSRHTHRHFLANLMPCLSQALDNCLYLSIVRTYQTFAKYVLFSFC